MTKCLKNMLSMLTLKTITNILNKLTKNNHVFSGYVKAILTQHDFVLFVQVSKVQAPDS